MFRPLGNRVLVQPSDEEQVLPSGFVVSKKSIEDKTETGTVVALGPEVDSIEVGEKIFYPQYGYDEVSIDRKKYAVVSVPSILGIL